MFLVKCSCGCIYTLKEEYVDGKHKFERSYQVHEHPMRVCPNCRMPQNFHINNAMEGMNSKDFQVYRAQIQP